MRGIDTIRESRTNVCVHIYNSHGSYVKGLYEEEDEKFYIFIILFFANFFLKNVIILSLN